MSENFGLKIGLEGEKEFKKSLAEINNSFKVLGSEMKLVDSQFDKNDKSAEALTARNQVLNKEIDQQKQKIETLRSALANAAESFGENDRRTQSWQIQLNNAQAALNGLERELNSNNTALANADKGFDEAGDEAKDFSNYVKNAADTSEDADGKLSKLGDTAKKIGAALGAAAAAVGTACVAAGKKLWDMANEVGSAGDQIDKTSQKIGISAESYQKWGYVFERCGADVDNLQSGMKKLSTVITDAANGSDSAAEKLSAVGLSIEDLNGKSQDEQLSLVISATYASFCSTVKFTLTKAGTVTFILKKDENEVMRYEEYFSEGSHTKTYTYPFTSETGQNTLSLSVLAVDGAEGDFPKMQSWGYVMGAYLAGDNPWDGYIELREDGLCFTMRRSERKKLIVPADTMLCEILKSHKFVFTETPLFFTKRTHERKTLEPTVHTLFPNPWSPKLVTPPPITAVNVSNRKLYIELRNPVTADVISTAAFTMIVTTETETLRLQPVTADFGTGNFGSTIWLAFGSSVMKDSVQSITLLYDGDVGNLVDVLNNAPCGSFQTSFIYTPYEEEQE